MSHQLSQHLPFWRVGASGLDLPVFSFGLWQKFGADYPYDTQREIILHNFEAVEFPPLTDEELASIDELVTSGVTVDA